MQARMKVLDLFSGIGGFSLGLHRAGMETVAFCEIEQFQQKVLTKNFPGIPIFSNIKTLTKEKLSGLGINKIDLVCGGFPCQPFSTAGKRKAFSDDRDLWPEMCRVIAETRPTWVIGENVAGFVNLGFTRTKIDLESLGYSVRALIIPACAVGAQHRRDRVWIIAHLNSEQLRGKSVGQRKRKDSRIFANNGAEGLASDADSDGQEQFGNEIHAAERGVDALDEHTHPGEQGTIAHTHGARLDRQAPPASQKNNQRERQGDGRPAGAFDFGNWWADQSDMGRAVYGVSRELDKDRGRRVGALGNSVVPQVVEILGTAIALTQSQNQNKT